MSHKINDLRFSGLPRDHSKTLPMSACHNTADMFMYNVPSHTLQTFSSLLSFALFFLEKNRRQRKNGNG